MPGASPAATKSSQASKPTTWRSSGKLAASASTVARIGLPRKDSTTKTPALRDCFSTYSTSCARNAGFTVTSTTPASAQPNSIITHSGRFGAHTATRSPGSKRWLQRARGAQRLGVQLGIGPLPSRGRVGHPGDQRHALGRGLGRPGQQLAERDVAQRRLGGAVGVGQRQIHGDAPAGNRDDQAITHPSTTRRPACRGGGMDSSAKGTE